MEQKLYKIIFDFVNGLNNTSIFIESYIEDRNYYGLDKKERIKMLKLKDELDNFGEELVDELQELYSRKFL
ncbi:MAG: hypothetical protein ABIB11_06205 [Candidatus Omnitrophota bacterium]